MPASQVLPSPAHRANEERPLAAGDLASIRLLELPELGPPFDDDWAAAAAAARSALRDGTGSGPGVAALSPDGTRSAAASPVPGAADAGVDGDWARQFARLLTEALSGARPVRQILPWTSERARVQLRALMPLFAGGQRPRVLRVIATGPAQDVIEMTVVADIGARTRALAVRLERADQPRRAAWPHQALRRPQPPPAAPRWLCTDIEAA